MRKRILMKRLEELERANLDNTSEIAMLRKEKRQLENKNNDLKNKNMKLSLLSNNYEWYMKTAEENKKLYSENYSLLDEIETLEEKNLSLQTDKEGLIEYAKKLRYMHSCAEDEIKRLNGICEMLNNNIEAQNVTTAQNDMEYYKLIEQNAFLAGQVKAYQATLTTKKD